MYRERLQLLYRYAAIITITALASSIVALGQPYPRGSGTLRVPGTTNKVHYTMKEHVIKKRNAAGELCQELGIWVYLEDKDGTGPHEVTMCAMVNFQRPASFTIPCKQETWSIDKNPALNRWMCIYSSGSFSGGNFYYHFGCNTVTVPKNGGAWAFDGYTEMPKKICEDQNGNFHEIELSDNNDGNPATFDYINMYVDALKGCPLDATCAGTVGIMKFLSPSTNVAPWDYYNIWLAQVGMIRRGDEGDGISTALTEIGNWRTMSEMPLQTHPARFVGSLFGAPAGAQFRVVFPANVLPQIPGAIVWDSVTFEVPVSSDCVAESTPINFAFTIPPDMVSLMTYRLIVPNTPCGNAIENGRQVQLLGDVIAQPGSPTYMPGDFIYAINIPFLRDVTPPQFGTLEATDLDAQRLALRVTTAEDVSMMVGAWAEFTVNDGEPQMQVLRYENNNEVNDSTVFRDTLDFEVDSATVILRVIVVNEVGLTDTSEVDTCYVYGGIASSVPGEPRAPEISEGRVRHFPNPVSNLAQIRFSVLEAQYVRLRVYDALGRELETLVDQPLEAGTYTVGFNATKYPPGTYHYTVVMDGRTYEGAMVIVR